MNIEQLSKSQLLLLTLLVSFVTSTATGVLTVSLLEETPQTITQTVNRVVERTIERVDENNQGGAAVVTRETTVVVKEEDVLGDSVQAHSKRLVSLYVGTTTGQAVASGLFLPSRGFIATGSAGLKKEGDLLLKFANGTVYAGEKVQEGTNGIALVQPVLEEGEKLPSVQSYDFGKLEGVRRGQSVYALGSRGAVETGIVSLIDGKVIETNLVQSRIPYGGTLISTLGDVIGMHVSATEQTGARFVTIEEVLATIDAYLTPPEESEENATI